MELKCENCGKEWDYSGKNKVYTTCPDCRKLVRIPGEFWNENSGNAGGVPNE